MHPKKLLLPAVWWLQVLNRIQARFHSGPQFNDWSRSSPDNHCTLWIRNVLYAQCTLCIPGSGLVTRLWSRHLWSATKCRMWHCDICYYTLLHITSYYCNAFIMYTITIMFSIFTLLLHYYHNPLLRWLLSRIITNSLLRIMSLLHHY